MEKWIISLIGSLLVSNSISTVPQAVSWVQLPHITIRCIVESSGIVLGNGVEGSQPSTASSPLGQVNFTDIREQFFEPVFLTNNSKYTIPTGLMEHFWAFKKWGLARFGQNANNPIMAVIKAATGPATVIQNSESVNATSPTFISYKIAVWILIFFNYAAAMVIWLFIFVKRLKQ